MFEIGFWELVVVVIVALCVFDLKRFPALMRVCGRHLARGKQLFASIKNELQIEFERDSHGSLPSPDDKKPGSSFSD